MFSTFDFDTVSSPPTPVFDCHNTKPETKLHQQTKPRPDAKFFKGTHTTQHKTHTSANCHFNFTQ